jgi:hypothetical protein
MAYGNSLPRWLQLLLWWFQSSLAAQRINHLSCQRTKLKRTGGTIRSTSSQTSVQLFATPLPQVIRARLWRPSLCCGTMGRSRRYH